MNYTEIMNKVEEFYDKRKEDPSFDVDSNVRTFLEQECNIIEIACRHIVDMRPAPELVRPDECPYNKDGNCYACNRFVCFENPDPERGVFSYMTFTGYCAKDEEDNTSENNERTTEGSAS